MTHGDRGFADGAAHADAIARTASIYERLFETLVGGPVDVETLGAEAFDATSAFAPDLADEIERIGRGAGLAVERVAALNARTEILAKCRANLPGECSAVVVLGAKRGPVAVQTWDWHEELSASWLVREIRLPGGRVVRTLTEHGIVGKIGVSSAGIGTLFTILKHARDGGRRIGVPVHVIARRILDEARTVDEAVAIASEARVSASTAVTVVSTGGPGRPQAASIELYPGGPARVEPDERGVLVHTNHFLDPAAAGDDLEPELGPDTLGRLDHLRKELAERDAPDLEDTLAAMDHHVEDEAICRHPPRGAVFGERYATLATVALDLARGELAVFEGGPCTARRESGRAVHVPE
jgi:isopenicillin-N N-acyltransferase like protein